MFVPKTAVVHLLRTCLPLGVVAATSCSGPSNGESSRTSAWPVTYTGPIVGLDGKCLDANGGSSANGTKVQLWTCDGSPAQQWTLSNGQILGPGGACLDVTGNTSTSGTPVELWGCWGGPNQQWSYDATTREITGIGGKCLDVTGGNSADGTQVIIWDCWDGPNQQWTMPMGGCNSNDAGTTSDAGSTSDGGASTGDAGPPPPPIDPNAFYVSPSGSDGNDGSLAAPFATLEHAQSAMQASSTRKTAYLRAGTYARTATLNFGSADDGETWSYYPPDGVDSAVLDGGGTVDIFRSPNDVNNLTIDGIKFQNPWDIAIEINGNDGTIENCDIGNNHDSSEVGSWAPIVAVSGQGIQVKNNYVHDTQSQGIAAYAYSAGQSLDGTVISGNVVLRAVQVRNDGGAIYIDMHATNVSGGHVTVTNNFVRDYGSSSAQAEGIYLDDDSSNVTVTGNIIGPPDPSRVSSWGDTILNAGCSNTLTNNIIDLGSTGTQLISGWSAPGGGGSLFFDWTGPNVMTNNIVVSNYSGATNIQMGQSGPANAEYTQGSGYPTQFGDIANNLYKNYGGGGEDTTGNIVGDSSPIHQDPICSGALYGLAANSPAFSQIHFQPIAGGWGPPGFVIPSNTNHSCP
jgi:hypothetical protein